MKVKEAMHSGVTWVEPGTKLADVARKMRDEDIGAVPVGENDRLVGMITDRDIACRAVAGGGDIEDVTVRDVMSKGIVYCQEDEEIEDAVRIMEQKRIRRLPVLNDKKRMIGMLTLGDVSSKVPEALAGEVARAVTAHHA